mgnify:CR=1 FL=1
MIIKVKVKIESTIENLDSAGLVDGDAEKALTEAYGTYRYGEGEHYAHAMKFASIVDVVFGADLFGEIHFVRIFAFGDEEVDESNECHTPEESQTSGKHSIVGILRAKSF